MFQKILFIGVLLCSITTVSAQDDIDLKLAKIYLDKADVMIDSAKYDNALNFSKLALKIYQEEKNDTLIVKAQTTIANAFLKKKQRDSANYYCEQIFLKYDATKNKNTIVFAKALHLKGELLFHKYDMNGVVQNYKKALAIYQDKLGEQNYLTIREHNYLGVMLSMNTHHKEALSHHNTALENALSLGDENHITVIKSYSGMSIVYIHSENYVKAIEYCTKVIELSKKLYGNKHPTIADAYIDLATSYKHSENINKAIKYYEKALITYKADPNCGKFNFAKVYYNLASAYVTNKNFEKAFEFYKKTLTICQELLPPNHPKLADVYQGMGIVMLRLDRHEDAFEYHQKGLDILLKYPNQYQISIARIYRSFGDIYEAQNDGINAVKNIKKSIDIYKKVLGDKNQEIIRSYVDLGVIYRNFGEVNKAIEVHTKALETMEKMEDISILNKNSVYLNLAKNYIETNSSELVSNHLQEAFDVLNYQEKNGKHNFHAALNLRALKDCFGVKSDLYTLKLTETANKNYSDSIKINNEKLLKLYDHWYKELTRTTSRVYTTKEAIPVYENSILHLVERNKKEELKETFEIAEKTKSRLLTE